MGKMQFNYRSETLGHYVNVTVVYPTDTLSANGAPNRFAYEPGMKFQTIYLLHGGGDDDSVIYRYTNAELYAQKNCVMLVSPSLPNSFFLDTGYGVDYNTFLTVELPRVIRALFASSDAREDNFVVGFAMGGSGALAAAIQHPEVYSHCIDMSGGVPLGMNIDYLSDLLTSGKSPLRIYQNTFGDPTKLKGSKYDLCEVVCQHQKNGQTLPEFLMVAGSEEGGILDLMKEEATALKDLGCSVTFREFEGYGHEMSLWEECLKLTMDEWLPLRKKPIYPDERA